MLRNLIETSLPTPSSDFVKLRAAESGTSVLTSVGTLVIAGYLQFLRRRSAVSFWETSSLEARGTGEPRTGEPEERRPQDAVLAERAACLK